jgi:hypothetical protein
MFLTILLSFYCSTVFAEIDISKMQICLFKNQGQQAVLIQIPSTNPQMAYSYLVPDGTTKAASIAAIDENQEVTHFVGDWYYDVPVYIQHFDRAGTPLERSAVFSINPSMVNSRFIRAKSNTAANCL